MLTQRARRNIVAVIVLIAAGAYALLERDGHSGAGQTGSARGQQPAGFDYYLIALSWSPTWCESNPDDVEQCGRRGYGFVLHGLWPQYERGGGPRDCATSQRPDSGTISRTLAFMPSRGLIAHEWSAHGSCSGLAPEPYFSLADRAYATIRVPPQLTPASKPGSMTAEDVRQAFVDANPGLTRDMLGVSCHGRDLGEVRICVDNDMQPRRCGRGVRMSCPNNTALRIPLIRN
ncbi:MAG TPA: ribonuclease T2 [Dokdonella sp.]|uniref:ribonuclease T2 n=1 Tax=Dokdonella sp. TaxID=2291710 RepID=UPI002D043603|nr:ribonuclease T2 [Dokdonella sp.]HOX70184.1 ribonuclease T2 [Dokdonella sp.]HPG94366.1 ribonuclease T2 [Dokdonella sp.]